MTPPKATSTDVLGKNDHMLVLIVTLGLVLWASATSLMSDTSSTPKITDDERDNVEALSALFQKRRADAMKALETDTEIGGAPGAGSTEPGSQSGNSNLALQGGVDPAPTSTTPGSPGSSTTASQDPD